MAKRILITCSVFLAFLLPTMAQNNRMPQDDEFRPSGDLPMLIDPGFEAFKLAPFPRMGWYSDDAMNPDNPKLGQVTMTPDDQIKVEGRYSLRIEQTRPRAKNQGQAYLSQTLYLPKKGLRTRKFDLSVQMRGGLSGPVTIEIYVWQPEWMARPIARRNIKVSRDWQTTTVNFKVPLGYDKFGIWFYLPRDNEEELWMDDVRLTPRE